MIENFTEYYGWIEFAFFYLVAFAFIFGQIWTVNREIKKDKEKAARKAAEEEAEKSET